MKRTRKRILSLFLAGTMLLCQAQLPATVIAAGPAAGQSYPLDGLDPDKAKTKPTISLTQETITLAQAKASPTRSVVLSVSGADKKYAPTGLHIQYDSRLLLEYDDNGNYATLDANNKRLSSEQQGFGTHGFYLATAASTDTGRDGALWNFKLMLPSDVKEGDEFPIEIVYASKVTQEDMFTNGAKDSDGLLMQAYVFTQGIEQGYIRIADENSCYVKFDANGGSGIMEAETVKKGSEYTLPECTFTAPKGKRFVGWKVNNDKVMQPGNKIKADGDLILTAQWSESVLISFNANGGSGTMESYYIPKDKIINLPDCAFTPPKGKVFIGWKLGETAKILQPGQSVQVTRDMELIAQWGSAIYTLTFEPSEGSGTMEPVKVIEGSTFTLPECGFTAPNGKEFAGWLANAELRQPGEEITVIGDLTILAVWKDKTSGACGDNMAWEFDTETNTLTLEGEGSMYDFQLETDSKGNDVCNVPWHHFCRDIMFVNLPEGLTTIGNYAFTDCEQLDYVTIPEKVTRIGDCAFDYCNKLTQITLPESVAEVGRNAFADTAALKIVVILNPACKISDYNDATLGDPAKIQIASLTDSEAHKYAEKYNIAFIALDKGSCGANLTWSYDIKTQTLKIEGKGDMTEFASLEEVPWALIRDHIASISLPEGLSSISDNAFNSVSPVKEITLPAELKRIGNRAFRGSSLESVTIPEGVTYIGQSAFAVTELSQVTIPSTVEQIGLEAFCDCKNLTEIVIPNPKTVIGDSAATISNGLRANGFDESHIAIWEQYYNGVIRGEADSTAAAYAKKYGYTFEALRHRIHFTANGGSGEMADVIPPYGQPYKLPACTFTAPEKGMRCSKWLISGELKAVGETIIVTDEIEAMPIWEYAVCKVTFAANGGKGTQAAMQAIAGLEFSLPECRFNAPDGKIFIGWQIGEKTYQPGETVVIEKDTEIKAVWGAEKQKYTVGDVDGDGTVDMKDAMLLSRYIGGWDGIELNQKAADLDRDGKIDTADAMILSRYVAAWEGYDKYIIEIEE